MGQEVFTGFLLNKGLDLGKTMLNKFGFTKKKLKKALDDLELDQDKSDHSSFPNNFNPLANPLFASQMIGLMLGLLVVQSLLTKGESVKTNSKEEDNTLLGNVKTLSKSVSGLIFKTKPIPPKTVFEKMYDTTLNILWGLINPWQPFVWLILLAILLLNLKTLQIFVAQSDSQYFGGLLSKAYEGSIHILGKTNELKDAEIVNDKLFARQ